MSLVADHISVQRGTVPRTILSGVSLTVQAGEMIGLIGPNGAGKTTLLRALLGLQPCAGGRIVLDGRPLLDWPRQERARRIAYFAQGGDHHWPLTGARTVELGRAPHLQHWSRLTADDRRVVANALDDADASRFADRRVDTLSQGEQVRVLLARALAVEAGLLLADEPVAALDPRHQLGVMEVLHGRTRQGSGVLVVLHDLSLAARYCDRLVLLHQGQVLAMGSPESVLTAERLASAYGIEAEIGHRDGMLYVVPWRAVPGAAP